MSTSLYIAAMIFGVAAAFLIFSAFGMLTSVPGGELGPMLNLGLLHNQAMTFQLGIGAAIVSAIFFSAAAIVATLGAKED